jgi:hypothetical protein
MTDKEELEQDISSLYTQADEEKSKAFYSFLRQILISSTTLLGILISFYDKNDGNICSHVFFSISVATCAIGILCLAYLLFSEVEIQKSFQRALLKEQHLMKQENYVVKGKYEWKGEYPKFAKFPEYIAVFSFLIFLICLVVYVIIH